MTGRAVNAEYADFEAKIDPENAYLDYVCLINDVLKADVIMPSEVFDTCWKKISAAVREILWDMIFGENPQLTKASDLMRVHKDDACFYSAKEYNEWIVLVRDELLKRNMLDFWKNEIVKKEMGPCWSRDSDLFEESDDPAPAEFYNHGGCEAHWLTEGDNDDLRTAAAIADNAVTSILDNLGEDTRTPTRKLHPDTALTDYTYNMNLLGEYGHEEDEEFQEVFADARRMIWYYLFSENQLSDENYEKAAALLEEYKLDACFYNPWDYNDWIIKVKEEIEKRKYFEFWKKVIVEKFLGLCCAGDSDFFESDDDHDPEEFYTINMEVIPEKKEQEAS